MDDKQTLSFKQQVAVLKRLLRYVKPLKATLSIGFFFSLLATIADLIGPIIMKELIDKQLRQEFLNFSPIVLYIILYAITNLAYAFLRYFQIINFHKIGYKITEDLRNDIFAKLQSLGMRYFDQTPAGSIVSRVTNDTDAIQDMFNNIISILLSSVISFIGIIITMFILNVKLTLICLAFVPIAIFIIYLYQKYSTRFYMLAREKLSQLNTKLSESISGMGIIQIFNQEKRLSKEFAKINNDYYKASIKNIQLDGLLLAPIINLLASFALAAVFGYMGFESFQSVVSTGLMVAFIEYIYKFFSPIQQIMERLAIYQQAIVAGSRVFKIIDHQELVPEQNNKEDCIVEHGKIEFKNVTFSYDGQNNVLNDISFSVDPGETIALVGHTGSGKSSIINVMMRFYEFFEGDILIDGHSIKDYKIEELRSTIGLVLQDPFLFYGTIADNIRLQNKTITDQQIIDACEFVQADSFINQLEDGYQHKVIERGASFSTGQKQLLAFARTIVTDPKILVLDEATANIDTETESLIQEGLERIRKGRTTIAIAHRLSTIKDANMILVLDKGNIIEQGTHTELLDKKGTYYTMYQLQKKE